MKPFCWIVIAGLFVNMGLTAQNAISLKDVVASKFQQKKETATVPLLDGEHYATMSADRSAILQYAYRTGKVVDTLFNVSKARECTFKNFDGFLFSDDQKKILLYTDREPIHRRSFKANYFTFEIKRNLIKPLSDGGKQQIATFSPNGRMVAFVRDNNVYLKKMDYDTESSVTKDGEKGKITNGVPSWVYEEEFGLVNTLSWSPDNETLAFVRFDETNVPTYNIQYYEGMCPEMTQYKTYPGTVPYKYPVAGASNDVVSVHTYTVESRVLKKMQVAIEENGYIPKIMFTKNVDQLAVVTMNRNQNVMKIHAVNPKSSVSKLLYQEEVEKWYDVENLSFITFYPESFVVASSKSGFRQLYLHNNTGRQTRALTSGKWDVTSFYGYDAATGNCYFQAAVDGSMYRGVYRTDAKGVLIPLFAKKGVQSAQFSTTYSYAIARYDNATTPMQVTVTDKVGKILRTLQDNKKLINILSGIKYTKKEFFAFKNRSDISLNGYVLKPIEFDASKKYPVVMLQYSGPGSQRVLDCFEFGWEQFLTSQGYVVVCVDGRGTGGRGVAFMQSVYMQLGVFESQDQRDAAQYLATLPYVDAKNIGIMGWSYGGYNALMTLTGDNKLIKAGVAIAPVTDWRFYDSIYTERYMRTPNENKDGYDVSSPLVHASQMNGRLLLVSGSADDNVHLQNTMQYSEALVQADKQFEMQIYTNRNHSISGCNTRYHLYTKILSFLNNSLK